MYTIEYYPALKRKETDTCCNVNESEKHDAKLKHPVRKRQRLCDDHRYMRDLEQSGTESRVLAARSWGWGGALIPSEHRVSVLQEEESSRDGW